MTDMGIGQGARQFKLLRIITAITGLTVLLALTMQPFQAAAAEENDRVQLGIKPVGVDGTYFELTMEPGEARQLTVELGNVGERDAVAMTYPADVYSLVNGGMGVRLAGEPTSGATEWISLEAETLPLAAGEGQLRTFAARVPNGAEPGEYITSVVIQDATPSEESSTEDGVVAKRVNRQAIAVAITVPGPLTPELVLGGATHQVTAGKSVISVKVENAGNVRLKPRGEFVLSDSDGDELTRFPVAMESVYAGAGTVAEIPFSTLLDPGDYIVSLSLTDATHGVTATTPALPLSIEALAAPAPAPVTTAQRVATVNQPGADQSAGGAGPGVVSVPVMAGTGALAVTLGGVTTLLVTRRRPSGQPSVEPAVPASVAATPASATMNRPGAIRQLAVPRREAVQASQPAQRAVRQLTVPRQVSSRSSARGSA